MLRKNSIFFILLFAFAFSLFGCGNDSDKPVKIHVNVKAIKRVKKGEKEKKNLTETVKAAKRGFKFTVSNLFRDPFKPFFKIEETTVEDNVTEHVVVTPLTRYKLSQFKLTAIISGKRKKPIGMVETEDGLGLFFQVGDYIGKELYKIVAIKDDRIILEKKERDFLNRVKIKRKEIILETEGE